MAEILNPQDAELEEVILGACLIGREAMPMVADRLRPEMFYFDKNALIYAAMQVMYREGRQIDIITVKNELVARGKLDADMVMLLYRPALAGIRTEPVSKYPSEHLGVVIVAKHRNGETGDVYFAHNPSMTKLGEYVPPTEWLMRNAK